MSKLHDLQDFIDYSVDLYTDLGDRLSVVEGKLAKRTKFEDITVPRGNQIQSGTFTHGPPASVGWALLGTGEIISATQSTLHGKTFIDGLTLVTGTLDLRKAKVLGLPDTAPFLPKWKPQTVTIGAASFTGYNTPLSTGSGDGSRMWFDNFGTDPSSVTMGLESISSSGTVTNRMLFIAAPSGSILEVTSGTAYAATLTATPTEGRLDLVGAGGGFVLSAGSTGTLAQLGGVQSGAASGITILGFHGNTAIARVAVLGSRGGNLALASLLTVLDTIGLITDSTTP